MKHNTKELSNNTEKSNSILPLLTNIFLFLLMAYLVTAHRVVLTLLFPLVRYFVCLFFGFFGFFVFILSYCICTHDYESFKSIISASDVKQVIFSS